MVVVLMFESLCGACFYSEMLFNVTLQEIESSRERKWLPSDFDSTYTAVYYFLMITLLRNINSQFLGGVGSSSCFL